MPRTLTNQVIIITGASSGIGAATAIACARAGMDVVLNARRADRLEQVAAQIRNLGRQAQVVAGDVTDEGINDRMLNAALTHFNRLDAVFANAGYGLDRKVIEVSEVDLRAMFDVNFFSGVSLLQQAARRMIETKTPGHLLMCSSCLAKFTIPFSGPYCATKAAQTHICRAMRMELKPHNIEVASVHPIGTITEFSEAAAKRSGKEKRERGGGKQSDIPRLFMQSSDRVANAVVRCLRHPKPEVWTSFTVRFAAAMMTLWPRLNDVMLGRSVKK